MTSRRCLACGRILTHPASVQLGYGPECRKKVASSAEVQHPWGEASVIVDRTLADRSIDAVRAVVRDQLTGDRRACFCGRPLSPRNIEYRDHGTGGLRLPGFKTEQWVWIHCTCNYDLSVWKIGVTQELVDQELDRQRGKSGVAAPVTTLAEFLIMV